MQLTRQTDFAFRTLIYLAQLPKGELAQIQQIGDYHHISSHHLSRVVMKLAKLGYVEAQRGKGGGIRLRVEASTINLAEVVKHFESTLKPVNCTQPRCKILNNCQLKNLLHEAMGAFLQSLAQHNLDDLVSQQATAGRMNLKIHTL